MRIYRHCVVSIAGAIDIDKLSERVSRKYPAVRAEWITLHNSVKALRFNAMSSGTIIADGKKADLSLDILCFHRHVFILEYQLNTPELEEVFLHPDLITKKVEILTDGEVSSNPLNVHGWMIIFNLLEFPRIIEKLQGINIFEENSKRETHQAFKDISLIDSYFLGDETNVQSHADKVDHSILCPCDSVADSAAMPVYEGDDRVCFRNGVYRMRQDDSGFLSMYRYLLYRDHTLKALATLLDKWMIAAREQAEKIRDNMNETNKVYWSKLKRKLEVWDLNFLDVCASSVHSLNTFDGVSIDGLSADYGKMVDSRYESARRSLIMNLDTLKYAISNLKTPCETHDEELLQSETEKVNERIMLLSFLAVSIPLLGAVFAPGFTASTKLIAAVFLFSLPGVYLLLRGMQKRNSERKAALGYLSGHRQKLLAERESTRKSLIDLSREDSLDGKTKSQTRELLRKNQDFLERQLTNIESEIRKLRG
jgi:hypothetical protein